MIIDGHAHACGDFLRAENIVKILDQNQVDKVVLVPGELNSDKNYNLVDLGKWFPNRDAVAFTNVMTKLVIALTGAAKHIPEGNHYVQTLVQRAPERIIQFYWVQLHRPGFLEETETLFQSWHFHGLKLHQCWEAFTVKSSQFDQLITWAEEYDLPIFLHMGSRQEVRYLIKYIRRHPSTTFIIGHLFQLEEYIQAELRMDNLYFDISTPPLISIVRLQKALDHFGAQRLILGSDTPYGTESLRQNIQRVKGLPLSEEEKALILGGNLQHILHLDAA
jgi:predicted TIM-barrel fold metal-dependent hydrolase